MGIGYLLLFNDISPFRNRLKPHKTVKRGLPGVQRRVFIWEVVLSRNDCFEQKLLKDVFNAPLGVPG